MRKEKTFDFVFSRSIGDLEFRIQTLKHKYLQYWWETESTLPRFFKTYTLNEQKEIEKEMAQFIEKIMEYSRQCLPAADPDDLDFRDPISQTRSYIKRLFTLSGVEIDDSFTDGIVRSTNIFIDRVKNFDPGLAPESIYQALRNIWVMNTLQVYFGQEIGCSDSMFAYSMLYPYTDNMMDDISTGLDEKLRLCQSLKSRLEGNPNAKPEGNETRIDALVQLVEKEFPRERFPQVFRSLLAIYNAQTRSLIRQHRDMPPYVVDIPGISFEKGGASVLADGCLLTGELDENREEMCFGLGAFLQLADDIQDVVMDKKNNHMTLFSQGAGRWKLDALANKLFRFIPVVVVPGDKGPRANKLDNLFQKSFYFHIMEAVGKNSELYSESYIKELQSHFPARFSFLKKLRKKLKKIHTKQKKGTFNLDVVSAGLMALTSRVYEGD